jgi:TRAP-type C4-dicarboxylate transport system permease small subunit
VTTEVAPARWTWVEAAYVAVSVVLIALIACVFGGFYYAMNWQRMSVSCQVGSQLSYSFSVTHGFTCTAADGRSESKYWW